MSLEHLVGLSGSGVLLGVALSTSACPVEPAELDVALFGGMPRTSARAKESQPEEVLQGSPLAGQTPQPSKRWALQSSKLGAFTGVAAIGVSSGECDGWIAPWEID